MVGTKRKKKAKKVVKAQVVYANGRRAAIEMLDVLLAQPVNIQQMRESLQDELNSDPAGFFKTFVIGTLPREALVRLEGGSKKAPVRIVMAKGK